MKIQNKFWFFIETMATITLIIAVGLTSLNIYPMNLYVSILGNVLWFIMGLHWRKWSLITIQTVIILIYIFGMIKNLTGA